MQKATINTDTRIYLVELKWKLTDGKYIFTDAQELVKILKQGENAEKGIAKLMVFDPVKYKFSRISKDDFLRFNNWHTEAMEYLKKYYYFKK